MSVARRFVEGMDYASFVDDQRTNFAVIRAIEIMGEAAKNIPADVRERFPEIPWQDMSKMRDKIIHAYFGVRLEVVWDTVSADIPSTLPAVKKCLDILLNEEGSQTS